VSADSNVTLVQMVVDVGIQKHVLDGVGCHAENSDRPSLGRRVT